MYNEQWRSYKRDNHVQCAMAIVLKRYSCTVYNGDHIKEIIMYNVQWRSYKRDNHVRCAMAII